MTSTKGDPKVDEDFELVLGAMERMSNTETFNNLSKDLCIRSHELGLKLTELGNEWTIIRMKQGDYSVNQKRKKRRGRS